MASDLMSTPTMMGAQLPGVRRTGIAPANVLNAPAAEMGPMVRSYDRDPSWLANINSVGSVGDMAFGAQFMLPIGAWLGRNTLGRLPKIGPMITDYAGAIFKAPITALERTKIGDLIDAPISALSSSYRDGRMLYAAEYGTMKGTELGANVLANLKAAESVPAALVTSGPFVEGHVINKLAASRANSHVANLAKQSRGLMDNLTRSNLGTVQSLGVKMGLSAAPTPNMLPDAVQAVHSELDVLKGLYGSGAQALDVTKVHGQIGKVEAAIDAAKAAGHADMVIPLAKNLGEMRTEVGSLAGTLAAARDTRGITETVGTAVKNASVMDVAVKGGFAVGAGYFALRTVTHAREAIDYLKELNEDLTGQKIGTWDVLMGSHMSPMMQEARANMIARFGPEAMAAAASAALNIIFMNKHLTAMHQALMFGAMGIQMSAGSMAPKQHLLDAYIQLKDVLKTGQQAPMEMYAALVDAASVEARRAGGVESPLVKRLAEEYAKEQINPADLLKEIEAKDKFSDRVHKIREELRKEDLSRRHKPAHSEPLVKAEKDPKHVVTKDTALGGMGKEDVPTKTLHATPETHGIAAIQAEHQGKLAEQHKEVRA